MIIMNNSELFHFVLLLEPGTDSREHLSARLRHTEPGRGGSHAGPAAGRDEQPALLQHSQKQIA